MQLRSTTRLPGRYREDDIPDPPGTASFVHPTVPYNPKLPPAAFPTLDYPRPVDTRPAEAMALPARPDSPESDPEQEAPVKRATVFHGKQQSSDLGLLRRLPSNVDSEELRVPESESTKFQRWDSSDKNITEPGEHDGWGIMAKDDGNDESPRIGLSVYESSESWAEVTDGLKLIITMELAAGCSFEDAMKKLMLTDEEHHELLDLFEREMERQADEEAKITRSQARQLEILMGGGSAISREASLASLEEDLYADLEDSPMSIIKKKDIAHAQRFLRSLPLREYADRLWRYEGVAQHPTVWNVLGPKTNEPSNTIESAIQDKQNSSHVLNNLDISPENGEKEENEKMHLTVDELLSLANPVKRRRIQSRPVSSKLPSGLRNSISADDSDETVALGPPAMQVAFTPRKQPAPPHQLRPVKENKFVTPKVKLVCRTPENPSTLGNTAQKPYTPLERTPDSPLARKQKNSRLADQVEPYTPLPTISEKTPSPLSTPSRVSKVRSTLSHAIVAQVENVLGKKMDVETKPGTPDEEHAIPVATPLGIPQILPKKARSATRHTDAEVAPKRGTINKDARRISELIHEQGGKVNELFAPKAQAQNDSVAMIPRQKKRKFQGQEDTAYRASGRRRPKIQEDEDSHKVSGRKRRKIQDDETEIDPPQAGGENKDKDNVETELAGSAAIQLKPTKVANLAAAKTNISGVATKVNASMTDGRKKAIFHTRKGGQEPHDDPDL